MRNESSVLLICCCSTLQANALTIELELGLSSDWLRAVRHGVPIPDGAEILGFLTVTIPALLPLSSGYRSSFTESKEARA
jgi:hypothetical protein